MDAHPNIKVNHAIAEIEAKIAAMRQELEQLGAEIDDLKVAKRVNERLHGPIPEQDLSDAHEMRGGSGQLDPGSIAQGKRSAPTIADRIDLLFENYGPMRTQQIWQHLKSETPDITFRTVVGTLQRSKGQGRFQLIGRNWRKG